MARFYLTADNSRGNQVTAQGKSSGQTCHIRGWSAGVEVIAHPAKPHGGDGNEPIDVDEFDIWMTSGSNGGRSHQLIGVVRSTLDGPVFIPSEIPALRDVLDGYKECQSCHRMLSQGEGGDPPLDEYGVCIDCNDPYSDEKLGL